MMTEWTLDTPEGVRLLDHVREVAAKLPEVEEKIDGFGHLMLQTAGKSFLRIGGEQGSPVVSFKADKETQLLLIAQGPYFKTPYIGQHGWSSIAADQIENWPELGQLIEEAYLRTAPKKRI